MQKTEFIEHVAKQAGVTKTEADKVVRATIKSITDLLAQGEKITLTGFGAFEVRERGEREVTHIRTKEKVKVAATKLPAFSAGSELKAAVNKVAAVAPVAESGSASKAKAAAGTGKAPAASKAKAASKK